MLQYILVEVTKSYSLKYLLLYNHITCYPLSKPVSLAIFAAISSAIFSVLKHVNE